MSKRPARPTPSPALIKRIALVVFDFDGVMTDNTVLVMQDGTEGVLCNRSDGLGIGLMKDAGFSMLVISKEQNPVVSARCRKLGLECMQGVDDKPAALARVLQDRGLSPAHAAYVGNDVNDVECMRMVGMPVAVADAWPAALKAAKFVTKRPGGHGAVREVCEWFLGARGRPE
ncbi:3-deoxy-D-manno-octulosonate 8-phosphate phosphatase (KDO 8-P phosphatase) [Phycisphaerales bacterium]|nr:3-deoxy-D-manno-octulosonate 8-phosphate phosphatase (KDO 8-P phosphatase) [Phycisphaerales bacterium]